MREKSSFATHQEKERFIGTVACQIIGDPLKNEFITYMKKFDQKRIIRFELQRYYI